MEVNCKEENMDTTDDNNDDSHTDSITSSCAEEINALGVLISTSRNIGEADHGKSM